MDDEIDELLVEVRASTQGFAQDVARMQTTLDTTLIDGFARAGDVLERGLLSAIRRGSLGFGDLKRIALQTIDEIAAQAIQSGLAALVPGAGGGAAGGGAGQILGATLGALFGLPGRATGGPVSPLRPYIVGERGPELFVPTSSGRIAPGIADNRPRDVRVAIQLAAPRGTSAPTALKRSAGQVAAAIRRSLDY